MPRRPNRAAAVRQNPTGTAPSRRSGPHTCHPAARRIRSPAGLAAAGHTHHDAAGFVYGEDGEGLHDDFTVRPVLALRTS
ncbi:hypothetical protein ACIOK4_27080 [Streptomyces bottropensis]|uniref:hypothetical protein n=1 Tax=Streptomyces bottropensis TaxID=42235 RepID=UPI00381828D5